MGHREVAASKKGAGTSKEVSRVGHHDRQIVELPSSRTGVEPREELYIYIVSVHYQEMQSRGHNSAVSGVLYLTLERQKGSKEI